MVRRGIGGARRNKRSGWSSSWGGTLPNAVSTQKELPNNPIVSMTNMAEYLAAEVVEEHGPSTPSVRIEHYPELEREAWLVLVGYILFLRAEGVHLRGLVCH